MFDFHFVHQHPGGTLPPESITSKIKIQNKNANVTGTGGKFDVDTVLDRLECGQNGKIVEDVHFIMLAILVAKLHEAIRCDSGVVGEKGVGSYRTLKIYLLHSKKKERYDISLNHFVN